METRYLVLLTAMAASLTGQCATIAFSGSGASGTINPDSLPWLLVPNDSTTPLNCGPGTINRCDISVWGVPGLGAANATWGDSSASAVAFTITFTNLPGGVTIDQTSDPDPSSFDDYTRFIDLDDSVVWTPSYSGGNTVTFTGPGDQLSFGTDFFLNIAFTGGNIETADFTGSWTVASVPEPGTLALTGLVLLGAAVLAAAQPLMDGRKVGRCACRLRRDGCRG